MAEVEAEQEQETEGGSTARQKLKTTLLIALGAILIATLSVGGTWFLLRGSADEADDLAAAGEMTEGDDLAPQGPAQYLAMQPPFIVNYTERARSRFLQLELSLMARDGEVLDTATAHMPLIRNNMLDVLARQDFATLQTIEGKRRLVDELTESVQAVMQEKLGRPGVETVLFRSFVMQ